METGWLVEIQTGSGCVWLNGFGRDGQCTFNTDSWKGIRFARREDALAVIACFPQIEKVAIATEHSWS